MCDLLLVVKSTQVGTDKAVVLTRGKMVAEDVRNLEDCGHGGACVVQTNHDPWRAKVWKCGTRERILQTSGVYQLPLSWSQRILPSGGWSMETI